MFLLQHNLRDPSWSMFYDNKHIREVKIPKFAATFIRAMKIAYKIKDKSDLFEQSPKNLENQLHSNTVNKLSRLAGYEQSNGGGDKRLRQVLLKLLMDPDKLR